MEGRAVISSSEIKLHESNTLVGKKRLWKETMDKVKKRGVNLR